jgi:peptide/nickel transport system substrate-binding protein
MLLAVCLEQPVVTCAVTDALSERRGHCDVVAEGSVTLARRSACGFFVSTAAVVATGLLVTGASGSSYSGVFRVAGVPSAIDPAITLDASDVLQATCAKLMNYPDRPMPAGTRIVPEVAAGYPSVSEDGRMFTFTIRRGFRFATGEPVTAASFAHAINRVLNPVANSPWTQYVQDIVGADAVMKGQATEASGVVVRGNKLTIRLTHAARDFPARTAFYAFCAVPIDLPVSAEGVGAPLSGGGPYTVAAFVPGQTLIMKRNPFYSGSRPSRVEEIDFSSAASTVAAVQGGAADYAEIDSASDLAGLDAKYRSQLHSVPGIGVRLIALNASQPLFKGNPALRRAVSFAINRPALIDARGGPITGRPTDQYLPASMPGFLDARIYPLSHADLARARALARGHTRGGRAVLYIKDSPIDIAQAQIIQRDLKPIGIEVKVKAFPGPALFQQLFTPGTPYDMTLVGIGPDYFDPYAMLNVLFDGRLIGTPYSSNLAHFNSPKYNLLLDAASRLTGPARYRAYGRLDVDLATNEAPMVAYENESALTFVSRRAGCLVLNPFLDLAAVCLR